jgi:Tol biopolymer transport system component
MPSLDDHFGSLTKVHPPAVWPELNEREPRYQGPPAGFGRRSGVAVLALAIAAGGLVFAVRAFQADRRPPPPAAPVGNGLIAFSRGGPEAGLYVMNPDGSSVRRLTTGRVDTDAVWSPDGSQIAFVRGFSNERAGIHVMDADGTDARRITDAGSLVDGSDIGPTWSPDGTKIAFAREGREEGAETGNADIYAVSPDGTNLVRLTDGPVMEYEPAWSPDGSRIAFVGYDLAVGGEPPSPVRLYVMNADGTSVTEVGPENVQGPSWSPDGSEIAYVDTESGSIRAIRPDGTGERRILDVATLVGGVHLVYDVAWSPDGTKLAFMAGPDAEDTHIYVANQDGTGVLQLTDDPASDGSPAWQPVQLKSDGELLRFEAGSGWHVAAFPGSDFALPYAWAANVPFVPEDLAGESATLGYPDATAESLREGGVLMVASVELMTRNALPEASGFPEGPLVLSDPQTGYEGQRPGTSLAVASATVNGRYVSVTALFGSERPSPKLVTHANDQLARLVVTPPPPPVRELDDFGIRMELPEDWHGWLFARGPIPQLHAGTLSTTDVYNGTSVRRQMGPDDVFLVLAESDYLQDRFEPVQLPITLRWEDECPTCEILDDGRGPPADHTLFARTFSIGDRRFWLYAEFGNTDVTDARLQAMNETLATLRIDATGTLEPSDPGATPTMLPPGPQFTANETTAFVYRGVRIDVPAGWTAVAAPLSDPAVAPVVAAFGSWPFPTGGACGPEPALASLPADGALVWIAEHPAPGNTDDFYRFTRFVHDPSLQPMRWECGASAPSRMDLWRLAGRYLEVHVALGPTSGPDRIEEVEALLNSLQVDAVGSSR